VNANLSYNPLNDLTAVAMISYVPHVLILTNKLGLNSITDLVALSKSRPITLATSGFGSASHMTVERFKQATGATITHVPYKSGGSLLPDVITGNVDGAMTELSTALELHKGGQARIIAVAGASRSQLAPDIPTFDEQGVKAFVARSFIGVVAPAKTPSDIVGRLQAAIAAGLAAGSSAAEKLAATGSELASADQMTSAGFAAFIKRDYEDMRAAAMLAGMGTK
jgi:tripartite-type tricarboxylate transporter receptor subunit TctC